MKGGAARPLAIGAAAGTLAAGLCRLGSSALESPAGRRPDELLEWIDDVGPAVASMTLLRLGAIGVATYLAIAAAVCVVASLRPSPAAFRLAQRATPRLVRRVLGVGALGSLALPIGVAAARTPAEPPPVLVQVDAAPSAPPTLVLEVPPLPAPPAPAPPPIATSAPSEPSAPRQDTWLVHPGDHLWSIAAGTVLRLRPNATEDDVARYWRVLIDANRDRLAIPAEPDLVFAGQEFILPPLDNVG